MSLKVGTIHFFFLFFLFFLFSFHFFFKPVILKFFRFRNPFDPTGFGTISSSKIIFLWFLSTID